VDTLQAGTALSGIEDGSLHAQHLELPLLGGTCARPGDLPALREEALRDVAANEARAEHKHVPRLRRRGHRRRRRHGGDSWNHPDSGSCPARLLWGAINLDDWITNSPFTVAKLID